MPKIVSNTLLGVTSILPPGAYRNEADGVSLHDIASGRPRVRYCGNGVAGEIACDFIAGCDGFHGISRRTIPETTLRAYEQVYPFGWLGILCDTPPVSADLIYVSHERGFALCSKRSRTRSRLFLQCILDDTIGDWPDERFWEELKRRLDRAAAGTIVSGPSIEKSIASLRSFVAEPMRFGRLFLAGDTARTTPPAGAKGLILAASDVLYPSQALAEFYEEKSIAGLDGYSHRALARIWQAERFSWWMTRLLRRFPEDSSFDHKVQRAELESLARSPSARTALAENYVGLPCRVCPNRKGFPPMKIVVFGPNKRTGALRDGNVTDLSYACAKYLREREGEPSPLEMAEALVPSDLGRLIEGGRRALDHAEKALDYLFGQAQDKLGPRGEALVSPAADMRLHAPRPNNARIACAGGNFADHAAAMAVKMRGRPYEGDAHQEIRKAGFWGFWKLAREIVGPDGELIYPERCNRLDYEGEIAIVLGKRGADLRPSQLEDYVWGATMLADWSIRAPRETPGGPLNFAFPKNFDTSCSLGPCIAVDEIDPTNVDIETLINGERRQRFNTRDMVFTFGEYLEHLSRDFTLYPGDIISGGTAAGTAADSSELLPDGSSAPERFLKPGDLVEMNSPVIGSLRTRVVAKKK